MEISLRQKLSFHQEDKSQYIKHLIQSAVIILLVVLLPFVFYSYEYFPRTKLLETKYFTYDSHYFKSVYVLIWTLSGKIVPLMILFIWYVTNKHWWKIVLFIPITMYLYQIIVLMNADVYEKDSVEKYWLFPIIALVLYVIYRIGVKVKHTALMLDLKDKLDTEIAKAKKEL